MPDEGLQEGPSPFRGPKFILSAAFLAVVTIMGAVMVQITRGDDSGSTGAPPPAPPANNAGGNSACSPADTDQQIPNAAPPGVTWQVFKAMALPHSASAGPMIAEGQVVRCYAHTPTGALMAAAQIGFRYSVTDDWRQLSAKQLIDGPGKKAFLDKRAANPQPGTPQQGEVAQIAGFRFVTYANSAAVIRLAFHNPVQNNYISAVYTVKWNRNDWMLELQPSGMATSDSQDDLPSIEGYTAWGGI